VPSFPDFVELHRALVYRFCLAALGPGDGDDCFQETFLAAMRAYPRLRDGEALDRWVLKIATRKVLDAHRRRAVRPIPAGSGEEVAGGRSDRTVRAEPDPADPLWQAVRALPPRQRVAVVHRYVIDLPYARIAELVGGTPEAVRANVAQAMRTLRGSAEVAAERPRGSM
jgi:RNA polymerase sigma factor (sigma-70 family)